MLLGFIAADANAVTFKYNDYRADDARQRVHPEPIKRASEQQTGDHKHGHCGIGNDMNHGGAHIVVTVR